MRILLMNGPNLNTLGTREPEIYGTTTLPEIERMVAERAAAAGTDIRAFQANSEGITLDKVVDYLLEKTPVDLQERGKKAARA